MTEMRLLCVSGRLSSEKIPDQIRRPGLVSASWTARYHKLMNGASQVVKRTWFVPPLADVSNRADPPVIVACAVPTS
jgi:hypothetical protein